MKFFTNLSFTRSGEKTLIFDPIRKKRIIHQPEELVRQLFLQYLILELKYSPKKIKVEKQISVLEHRRRFDILVYDQAFVAKIIVECKAFKQKISAKTFEQIALYNYELKVPYLVVTNGMENFCCKIDYEKKSYTFISQIPSNKIQE